ncbi:hypothetical protein H8K32_14660 [Undibacterium jejuense]|uniref:Uncharacterized protein n=2 Tax=Undibacterium jejuense TaxID=1344949 RepID=A0A923HJ33_9BURK|nr:hypothetical protein [Undibacterium jejuense]
MEQLNKSILTKAIVQDAALQKGLFALETIRQRDSQSSTHRSMGSFSLAPALLFQIIVLPIVFCILLLGLKPYIFAGWQQCILFFARQLSIPLLALNEQPDLSHLGFTWNGVITATAGDLNAWWVSFFMTLLALIGSFWLDKHRIPLKYLLRIICVLQIFSMAFFFFFPDRFPYTIDSHSLNLINMGYVVILGIPFMLSLGYYVLEVSLLRKIISTIYVLIYFLVLVPFQVMFHMLLLQYCSLLIMPVLYVCLGMLFDVLIFVALYSQLASKIGQQAMK